MQKYSFPDIRSWKIEENTPGRMIGAGFWAGTAAIGENKKAKMRAEAASGLFTSIKDINNPEWQITMPAKDQKKWFEIMTQFLND